MDDSERIFLDSYTSLFGVESAPRRGADHFKMIPTVILNPDWVLSPTLIAAGTKNFRENLIIVFNKKRSTVGASYCFSFSFSSFSFSFVSLRSFFLSEYVSLAETTAPIIGIQDQ